MMPLQIGDVVWVPFPHVETNRIRSRPALIVSRAGLGPGTLAWALMITNASNASWPGDILIDTYAALGLPVASVIRTEKIATLDIASARFLGHLPEPAFDRVKQAIHAYLAAQ